MPDERTRSESSFFPSFWPGVASPPPIPRKMDHLALNVDTLDDLKAVRQRLVDHGWEVSEVLVFGELWPHVNSIYTYDPDGLPLEIATFDFGDPKWQERTEADLHIDPTPPPFLAQLRPRA